ncbi:hypothetical protein AAU61_01130 [Desulfocarbo indianensis]|nr:hypothetical protein AAU61_01130 [Desulfocarbo indianensis]
MEIKRIICIEMDQDLTAYRQAGPGELDLLVALTPQVAAQTRRLGLPCRDTLAFFPPECHAEALRFSSDIYEWLERAFAYRDQYGFSDSYRDTLQWNLRFFTNYLGWLAIVLDNAMADHPGAEVWAALDPSPPNQNARLLPQESYIGALAARLCAIRGRRFHDLSWLEDRPPRKPQHAADWGGDRLHRRLLRRLARAVYRRRLLSSIGRGPILAGNPDRQMDQVAEEALKALPERRWALLANRRPLSASQSLRAALADPPGGLPLPKPPFAAQVNLGLFFDGQALDAKGLQAEIYRLCRELDKERELASVRGLSLAPEIMAKVRDGILPHLIYLQRNFWSAVSLMESLRPSLAVSAYTREDHYAIVEYGRGLGTPSLVISHGSFTAMKNEAERLAWWHHSRGLMHSTHDFAALQTPLAEEHVQNLTTFTRYIRTRPLAWGTPIQPERSRALRRQWFGDEPNLRVVMHAGSIKHRDGFHPYALETADEYIAGLRDVIQAIEAIPEARLVIRFRSSPALTERDLRCLLPESERFTISAEGGFLEVLGVADLLVAFCSTTQEEALQNRIPVLIYGRTSPYRHIAGHSLPDPDLTSPRAVYEVTQGRDLAAGLEQALSLHCGRQVPDEIFAPYKWRPEQIEPVGALISRLTASAGEAAGKPGKGPWR